MNIKELSKKADSKPRESGSGFERVVDYLDIRLSDSLNKGLSKYRFSDYRFTGLSPDVLSQIEDSLNLRWSSRGLSSKIVCDQSKLPVFKIVRKVSDKVSLVEAVRNSLSVPPQSLDSTYEWIPAEFGKKKFTDKEIEEAKSAVMQAVSETGLIDYVDGDASMFQVRINVTPED